MKKIWISNLIIFTVCNVMAGEIPDSWDGTSSGIIISNNKDDVENNLGNSWETIVDILFKNNISGNEMYYTGPYNRGDGHFWIKINGLKHIILETYTKYGPTIRWHNDNIAEIFIPTGSPFRHFYFFDFRDKKISDAYMFPIYLDTEKNIVILINDGGLDIYDFKNNIFIRHHRIKNLFVLDLLAFGKYKIKIENDKLYFIIEESTDNTEGTYIYDY
ncbi:hypothetical protein AGMMS49940_24320 [Spirochaetia bacterium]|nr:hypothetical protein AGMMS49940_24320 [Spirochaetia bacterium]